MHLKQTKRKSIYYSDYCPFTGYKSNVNKRIFRYNSKLGVIKCYCCGASAKELYWLKLQIENKEKFQISSLYSDVLIKSRLKNKSKEEIELFYSKRIKAIKETGNAILSPSVKIEEDDFPF